MLNSYDDFTPLSEIIVGSAENYVGHDRDLTFELFFHESIGGYRSDWAYPRLAARAGEQAETWKIGKQYTEELHEDVENLAATLTSLGITVHRPLPLPEDALPIAGLGWQAAPIPALNVRDNTLVLGDEIIETPPAIRSRYLETRLLSNVFRSYFDTGARWTTMPRPTLTDRSFDLSYAQSAATTLGGPTEPITDPQPSPYDVGVEMMLDGAQVLRLGQDLLVNVAQDNHRAAVDWLTRHLQDRFRVHTVYRMADNHIDSMLLALRPGVFLARHAGLRDMLPAPFRSWKFIVPPEPEPGQFPVYTDAELLLTSPYIDINVLSLDEERVLVNADCPGLIKTLENAGFTVIPLQHRHRRLFGGGAHCFTLDTHRAGGPVDYR
ncbi:glycine amidinotransferase [Streptomyces sp. NPDC051452]|uniref:glycine amidinotransferase n=1 Tax=Streptomyces sp. NPDC051452 TaxID=3365654 RepID=UPI0037A727AA